MLSKRIREVEGFWAVVFRAGYNHAGIVTTRAGSTIEALWTFREHHLASYDDCPLLVARPVQQVSTAGSRLLGQGAKNSGMLRMFTYLGQRYPAWRLLLHLVPPLARRVGHGDYLVCSEAVAKYLWLIGAREMPYLGVNPDTLADEWHHWGNFQVVYERP